MAKKCLGICCGPKTICKEEDNKPKCIIKDADKCPTGTSKCRGFSNGLLCCVNGKEQCRNLKTGKIFPPGITSDDSDVTCVPIPTGCDIGQIYCPGVGNTRYENFSMCCPAGSKCAQHPDGTPNCVN